MLDATWTLQPEHLDFWSKIVKIALLIIINHPNPHKYLHVLAD
jgi:hypothetical protein